jgi:hypothetical protein
MSAPFQYGNVEERVARSVGELNEPEAFLCIEPLDDGVHRRTRRRRIRARCRTKWLAWSFVGHIWLIVVKSAASLISVSPFSHLSPRPRAARDFILLGIKTLSRECGNDMPYY